MMTGVATKQPELVVHQPELSDSCPVCLDTSCGTLIRLSCNHSICSGCAAEANTAGLSSCPLCRHPHLLDPAELKERQANYRSLYGSWRKGSAQGSHGELSQLTRPNDPLARPGTPHLGSGLHCSSAGDLAVLEKPPLIERTATKAFSKSGLIPTLPSVPHGHLGFAIVGMGRAGKIHLNVLRHRPDVEVRWLVDVCEDWGATAKEEGHGARMTTQLADALADPAVDCVIVSTPTPTHGDAITAALHAGKHVFAEKPLCCDEAEVPSLFHLASSKSKLLHTAYNRRSDPHIQAARAAVMGNQYGKVHGCTLVSRDFPYPTKEYLATSGNLFKDCVVHDLDYVTWILGSADEGEKNAEGGGAEEGADREKAGGAGVEATAVAAACGVVASLRASASIADESRACGMWEYSTVDLTMADGVQAHLTNARVSTSYDHRLDIYCGDGAVRVANLDADAAGASPEGTKFSDRFAQSYHQQLGSFIEGVKGVLYQQKPPRNNLSLARTLLLAKLVKACELSVAKGGAEVVLSPTAEVLRVIGEETEGGATAELEEIVVVKNDHRHQDHEATEDALSSSTTTSDSPYSPSPSPPLSLSRSASPPPARPSSPVEEAGEEDGQLDGGAVVKEAAAALELASSPSPSLRTYDDTTAGRVKALYAQMRASQSVEHVQRMRLKYTGPGALGSIRMSIWDALEKMASFVDVSDPDVTLPNHIHAYQTAEGLRSMKMPDWMQLTGLLHDLGKMIHLRGSDADGTSMRQQWSIVGDTWVVGCAMPDQMIFPELSASSPDKTFPERCTEVGIYHQGCGLDNVLCAFGHDEFMYEVLKQNAGVSLPYEALYIIRYHSLYPWHDQGCYQRLESEQDRMMKGWVKLFNQHDLYTKRDVLYSPSELQELKEYYTVIADKYLPRELDW